MRLAPDVSAVIPHYGPLQSTLQLIELLQQQTFDGEIEIIVSDDNSPEPFPLVNGVKVVHRTANGGFGTNVNTGAEQATGQWLMILNSDLELSPTFVEEMLNAVKKQPQPAIYSPQVVGHQGECQWVARKFPSTFIHAWNWFTPVARFRDTNWWHRLAGHDVRAKDGKTLTVDWLMGACLMLPTRIFREVGGFDERFFMNSEEVDLQKRLGDRGYPAIFLGDVKVTHEGGGSSESTKRRHWLTTSHFIYEAKWNKRRTLNPTLIAVSLLNFGFNIARSMRNKQVKPIQILSEELGYLRGQA